MDLLLLREGFTASEYEDAGMVALPATVLMSYLVHPACGIKQEPFCRPHCVLRATGLGSLRVRTRSARHTLEAHACEDEYHEDSGRPESKIRRTRQEFVGIFSRHDREGGAELDSKAGDFRGPRDGNATRWLLVRGVPNYPQLAGLLLAL